MKPRGQGGVVDSRLNVYGVKRLKLADLSVAPGNVAANTYSTALVIGEKAAVIIAEELDIRGVVKGSSAGHSWVTEQIFIVVGFVIGA
jgi:alcohol oxidase